MDYDIRLERHGSVALAVVRRSAIDRDLAKVVPEACGLVWDVIRSRGISGTGRHVALYRDGPANLEVGVELAAPFAGEGDVVPSATPAGTVATTIHYGPYGRLRAAHDAIRRWCGSHGHALAGPSWEVYGHWKDEWSREPAAIRTDVYYLLAGTD